MTSSQAEPGTIPDENTHSSKPGWWRRKIQFVTNWWLVLFTGAAATAIASFLYVGSALVFKAGQLDYGFGFALGGLAINAMPPAIVWAVMKWIR